MSYSTLLSRSRYPRPLNRIHAMNSSPHLNPHSLSIYIVRPLPPHSMQATLHLRHLIQHILLLAPHTYLSRVPAAVHGPDRTPYNAAIHRLHARLILTKKSTATTGTRWLLCGCGNPTQIVNPLIENTASSPSTHPSTAPCKTPTEQPWPLKSLTCTVILSPENPIPFHR